MFTVPYFQTFVVAAKIKEKISPDSKCAPLNKVQILIKKNAMQQLRLPSMIGLGAGLSTKIMSSGKRSSHWNWRVQSKAPLAVVPTRMYLKVIASSVSTRGVVQVFGWIAIGSRSGGNQFTYCCYEQFFFWTFEAKIEIPHVHLRMCVEKDQNFFFCSPCSGHSSDD